MKRHTHSIGAFTTVLAASLVMDSTAFANEQTDQQEIINSYRWWAQGFEQKNLNQVLSGCVLNYTCTLANFVKLILINSLKYV